jgi:hypothetical protein
MKRITALALAVATALVLASTALALSRVLHGPAGSGSGSVDVQFNIKNGHVTKITRFEFNNIAASCTGYPATAVSDSFAKHISVTKQGKFHAAESRYGGRVTYNVAGHFITLHKVAGTLRIKGTVPGCVSADTGKVHFSAPK